MVLRSLVRTIWNLESIGPGQPADSAIWYPQRGQADSEKAIIQVSINQDPVGDDNIVFQGRLDEDASWVTIVSFDLGGLGAAGSFVFGVDPTEIIPMYSQMRISTTVDIAWNIAAGTTASIWFME